MNRLIISFFLVSTLVASSHAQPPVFYNYLDALESKITQDYGEATITNVNGYRYLNYKNDFGVTSFKMSAGNSKVLEARQMSQHESESVAKELHKNCVQYLIDDHFKIETIKGAQTLLCRGDIEVVVWYHLYDDEKSWLFEIIARKKQ
jgi:hypothetical protein